jgi:hypothetical protein
MIILGKLIMTQFQKGIFLRFKNPCKGETSGKNPKILHFTKYQREPFEPRTYLKP